MPTNARFGSLANICNYNRPCPPFPRKRRAIAEMKAYQSIAISKFNHNDPGFRDRDLFVFCFDRKTAKPTAHEALVGWDVRRIRDAAGRATGDAMFATAKEGQLTEIAFLSPIPGTTTLALTNWVSSCSMRACAMLTSCCFFPF
jgi:hypothetical protein